MLGRGEGGGDKAQVRGGPLYMYLFNMWMGLWIESEGHTFVAYDQSDQDCVHALSV